MHTKGPLTANGTAIEEDKPNGTVLGLCYSEHNSNEVVPISAGEAEANARLWAASPEGLEAAEIAYLALCKHPHDSWRCHNQLALIVLRDYIANATGRTAEEVQNKFSEKAAVTAQV